MLHALLGSTRRRLFSLLALAGAAAAGLLSVPVLAGAASAAPVAAAVCPGGVEGALACIQHDAARGWYIDPNGTPHYLPKGPNAVANGTGDYPGLWFKGDTLDSSSGGADVAALVKAEVTKQLAGVTAGPAAKHVVVKFDADWATNTAVKQLTKCPILKLTGISTTVNGQYLDPASFAYGAETKASPTASAPFGRYCFAFTSQDLPKYSASQPELWGSNVSDSSMASESDVTVLGEVLPSNGATTRTFIVSINAALTDPAAPGTIAAFSNSRQFTVDAWTLAVA